MTSRTTTPAQPLVAAESGPVAMGCMRGSPPPDKMVRFAAMGCCRIPKTRRSFANFRKLVLASNISRGQHRRAAVAKWRALAK